MNPSLVLLIEDSDEDFAAITRALKSSPVAVTLQRCQRGEEALEFLQDPSAARPALILLDLNLPNLDGRAVLRRVKDDEALRHIPVIVLTTSSNPRDVLDCYREGVNSYQIKLVNYPQFKKALHQLLVYWLETALVPGTAEHRGPY